MGWGQETIEVLKKGLTIFPDNKELKGFLEEVEENIDDGDENPTLLALLFLMVMIHKKLRKGRS